MLGRLVERGIDPHIPVWDQSKVAADGKFMDAFFDDLSDLGQMQGHGFGVAAGQDQARGLAFAWADGAEEPNRTGALVTRRRGPAAALGPRTSPHLHSESCMRFRDPQLIYCNNFVLIYSYGNSFVSDL